MRSVLWVAFLIRWSITLVLLLLIAIDLGWVLALVLLALSAALEVLVHQVARLRRELRELRVLRQSIGLGTSVARERSPFARREVPR